MYVFIKFPRWAVGNVCFLVCNDGRHSETAASSLAYLFRFRVYYCEGTLRDYNSKCSDSTLKMLIYKLANSYFVNS